MSQQSSHEENIALYLNSLQTIYLKGGETMDQDKEGVLLKLTNDLIKISKDLVKGTVNTVENVLKDVTKVGEKKEKVHNHDKFGHDDEANGFLIPVMEELIEKMYKKVGWMIMAKHLEKDEKIEAYKYDLDSLMMSLMKLNDKTKFNMKQNDRVKKLYKNLKVLHDYVEKHFK